MKVRCISLNEKLLNSADRENSYLQETADGLIVGKVYDVLAVQVREGLVFYLLWSDYLSAWYSAEIFEIIDGIIPEGWSTRHFSGDLQSHTGEMDVELQTKFIIGPRELISDVEKLRGVIVHDEIHLSWLRKHFGLNKS